MSLHRYTYALADPVDMADPSGQMALVIVALAVIGILAISVMPALAQAEGNPTIPAGCASRLTNDGVTNLFAALIFAEVGDSFNAADTRNGARAVASVIRNRQTHITTYRRDRRWFGNGTANATPAATILEVMMAGRHPYRTQTTRGWRPDIQFGSWNNTIFQRAMDPAALSTIATRGQRISDCDRFSICQTAAQATDLTDTFMWLRTQDAGGPGGNRFDAASAENIAGNTFWSFRPECEDPLNVACNQSN